MKKTYIFITTMLIVSNLAFSQKKKAVVAPVPDKLELLKQEVIKKIHPLAKRIVSLEGAETVAFLLEGDYKDTFSYVLFLNTNH